MEIREFTCKVAAKPESDYMRSLKKTSPHSTARTAASEIELEYLGRKLSLFFRFCF